MDVAIGVDANINEQSARQGHVGRLGENETPLAVFRNDVGRSMHEAKALGEAVPEQAPEGIVCWGHLELAVV